MAKMHLSARSGGGLRCLVKVKELRLCKQKQKAAEPLPEFH
jgi:hypothetical protein